VLVGFRLELNQAVKSPSFWLAVFLRSIVLLIGLSLIWKWALRSEGWSFQRAFYDVLFSWTYILLCIFSSRFADRHIPTFDVVRVFWNLLVVLPKSTSFWTVVGLVLLGVGETKYSTLIALYFGVLYVARIVQCDVAKTLATLPVPEKKRGFATYERDFPPQTR
jgi:hypothetical protein